jgi:signal transduction histidine kinase/CHASE3 domain sensor protein
MLHITQAGFKRRLTSAIALPIILLLSLSGVSIWQITRLLSVMEWANHTDQVITEANILQKLLLDLETGVRGYLLTNDPEFLQPYQQASSRIDGTFNELGNLVVDNPRQVEHLKQIESQKIILNRDYIEAIANKKSGNTEPIGVIKVRKQKMDALRSQIADFIATEEQLRNQRTQAVRRTTQQFILSSVVLSIVTGGILAYFIRRQLLKVSQTYTNALITANEQSQRLMTVHNIDKAILAAESIQSLVQAALTEMRQLVSFDQGFVALFNFETGTSEILAGCSTTGELQPPQGTKMTIEDFAPDEMQQSVRYLEDLTKTTSYPPIIRHLKSRGICCCLCVPMVVEKTLLGDINLATTKPAAFDSQSQDVAREVAAQLAIAIQQYLLREQLQRYTSELEQRVAERTIELQEKNQELEAFTSSISHDLRAPLRTMQGFAQALQEDYNDNLDDIGREYIRYISDGAVQMDTLIAELLAYSRLSRIEIRLQAVDLTNVVAEALKQLKAQIEEQQAKITVVTPLPQVMAHKSTLIQVVTNLISNAIKFVKPGIQPQVQISAALQQDWIRLSVVDNGIGIAPQHQERIFGIFERLHGVELYSGTGIGLATVRKGIERMGGKVGVSQHNSGSCFWITLPKAIKADDSTTPHLSN